MTLKCIGRFVDWFVHDVDMTMTSLLMKITMIKKEKEIAQQRKDDEDLKLCSSEVLKMLVTMLLVEYCNWSTQDPRLLTCQEPRSTTVPVVKKPEEPFADIQVEPGAQEK